MSEPKEPDVVPLDDPRVPVSLVPIPVGDREEAEKVTRNLNGDVIQIADYLVQRCGDFVYDRQRRDFIAEFLRAAAEAAGVRPPLDSQLQTQAIEKLRWTATLCGACGEGYLQCRGCGQGIKAGLRSTTDRAAQCGGHVDVPCSTSCIVYRALTFSEGAAASASRLGGDPAIQPRLEEDLKRRMDLIETCPGLKLTRHLCAGCIDNLRELLQRAYRKATPTPTAAPHGHTEDHVTACRYTAPACVNPAHYPPAPAAPAPRPGLTAEEIAQISEGITEFIMNGDPEVDAIWQPYVDKLRTLEPSSL